MGINKVKKGKTSHKRSVILISTIVLTMIIVLGSHSISLLEQRDFLMEQEEELLLQIEQQEIRRQEILELEEFIGTPEHVRIVAEEELDLVNPNAIIFRPVD